MYIVPSFLNIRITQDGERQTNLEDTNPRNLQSRLNPGNLIITFPREAVGRRVGLFIERLESSPAVFIDGTQYESTRDAYLDRSRVVARFTPSGREINIALNLIGNQRTGTIVAWLVDDEIEISGDVFAAYPFNVDLEPRTTSDRKENGDEVVKVIGTEPKLSLTINLKIKGDYADVINPDDLKYLILRATSPQKNFLFSGRDDRDTYLIGKSTRRTARHVYVGYERQQIQPLLMEVL